MTEQNFELMRRAMVSNQLRTTAVNDPRIVAAITALPRERFVPAERREVAYTDTLVPLGGGRALNTPMATGRLLTEAAPTRSDRVLLIGAATGYAAALLSQLAGSVVALDEREDLLATARAQVTAENVAFVSGPLTAGWAAGAPYSLVVIDGAVERIPAELIAQLGPDGRLAAAISDRGVIRLAIGRKAGDGFGTVNFADAEAAPLPGFAEPAGFVF